ncbi:MAG: hypothetical protein ACI9Y7_003244 [Dokdonia sp.]|jgi:hypothetical protein
MDTNQTKPIMKKLKLNKFTISQFNTLHIIKGGGQNTNEGQATCPTDTVNKTLTDPDLPGSN